MEQSLTVGAPAGFGELSGGADQTAFLLLALGQSFSLSQPTAFPKTVSDGFFTQKILQINTKKAGAPVRKIAKAVNRLSSEEL